MVNLSEDMWHSLVDRFISFPNLRTAFVRTLKLDEEHTIAPENSHLFAAIGSALNSKKETSVSLLELKDKLRNSIKLEFEVERMEPLFATEEDYKAFDKRQSSYRVKTGDLASYKGNCYLGIDAGSTTTKTALVGEDGSLLYSFYSNNNGSPLKTAIRSIQEIYSRLTGRGKDCLCMFHRLWRSTDQGSTSFG